MEVEVNDVGREGSFILVEKIKNQETRKKSPILMMSILGNSESAKFHFSSLLHLTFK